MTKLEENYLKACQILKKVHELLREKRSIRVKYHELKFEVRKEVQEFLNEKEDEEK